MGNQIGNLVPRFGGNGGDNRDEEIRYDSSSSALYFGDHFVMGGQEFPALDPEAFLFGDMSDLNYLARMPGVMDRHPPNLKHTNVTRCLFFVDKETIRLVPHATSDGQQGSTSMHLDFKFDADCPCRVTVHFFAKEEVDSNGIIQFKSKFSWPTFFYGEGIGQTFSHPEATIDNLVKYSDDDLFFQSGSTTYPVVIHIVTDADGPQQSLATYGTFERSGASGVSLKPLVQKANIQGLCLVLKEIFGIEKKDVNEGNGGADDYEDDDDNVECVVCMSQAKDTMALPCRHLCLCNPCADVLRFQANKCPICRAPFHSLLQIRVLKPEDEMTERDPDGLDDDDDEVDRLAELPPGFRSISLAEAVSGAESTADTTSPAPSMGYVHVAEVNDNIYDAGPATVDSTSSSLVAVGPNDQSQGDVSVLLKSTYSSSKHGKGKLQTSANWLSQTEATGFVEEEEDGADDPESNNLGKVNISDFPSNERLQVGNTSVWNKSQNAQNVGEPGNDSFHLPGTPSTGTSPMAASPSGGSPERKPLMEQKPASRQGGQLEI